MFDLLHFFISPAMAQGAAPAPKSGIPGIANIVSPETFLVLTLLAVWFFLVIRPQQQKMAEQEKMIKALQRGDRVITSSGIHGKIAKLEGDDQLVIEIADGVQIKIERSHVSRLADKPKTAADKKEGKKEGEKK